MKQKVFSVFDHAAAAFSRPFFQNTEQQAYRALEASLMDERSNVNKWPQDYSLYEIGEFDDVKGELTACAPRLIINALALKNQLIRGETEEEKE